MVALERVRIFPFLKSTTVEILWWLQRLLCGRDWGESTTVEILWWLQRQQLHLLSENLQQQKSYGGFRGKISKKTNKSTTVEILWWLQSSDFPRYVMDLQQQKSYGGFRAYSYGDCYKIYNSRNLMVALENILENREVTIYNSRNLMVALEIIV